MSRGVLEDEQVGVQAAWETSSLDLPDQPLGVPFLLQIEKIGIFTAKFQAWLFPTPKGSVILALKTI